MPPVRDGFRSTSDRPEERATTAPSSNKRPEKWTRGGQGKKIKQDGKTKESGKTKQDGKVGQQMRYPCERCVDNSTGENERG
jgi:hypothetical protein